MTTMTNTLLCEKCNNFGWDMIDGVCSVCLDSHEEATPTEYTPKCGYCGEPVNLLYVVWVNGRMVEKNFCNNMCANYYQMGAEG